MSNKSHIIKDVVVITLCMGLTALAVHYFLQPSGMTIGSLAGLAIVIYRLTDIPVSLLTFAFNAVFLILAFSLIGKEFGAKTVFSSLIMSPWLWLMEAFDKKFGIEPTNLFDLNGVHDYWFYMLCFILVISFTQAILFRINACTGGIDIIAKLFNVYFHVEMGTAVTVAGFLICCTAFFIPDTSLYLVLMGFIGTWINGVAVDYFSAGFGSKKRVCIVTKDYKRVQDFIVNELVRGVTLYEVTGGYTNENKVELESILTRDEFAKLMDMMRKEHIDAFMTAGKVSEIYGIWKPKGFKIEK